MTAADRELNRAAVERAHERIAGLVERTPVVAADALSERVGAQLFFKCENLQTTGAFKFRGATHAVVGLDDAVEAVATHSSGNHGAALACAAERRGLRAYIVVPEGAPQAKLDNIARYGAEIVRCGRALADREAKLEEVVRDTSAAFIPPYDDARIIAGQGTAALELMQDVVDLDQIWVPIGGGGLASGTVLAASEARTEVLCAEPELARDAFLSLESGVIHEALPPETIADGLRTSLGKLPFSILMKSGTRVLLASERGIVEAVRLIEQATGQKVETSSAVPIAAMLEHPGVAEGRVGVILSGGNVSA